MPPPVRIGPERGGPSCRSVWGLVPIRGPQAQDDPGTDGAGPATYRRTPFSRPAIARRRPPHCLIAVVCPARFIGLFSGLRAPYGTRSSSQKSKIG